MKKKYKKPEIVFEKLAFKSALATCGFISTTRISDDGYPCEMVDSEGDYQWPGGKGEPTMAADDPGAVYPLCRPHHLFCLGFRQEGKCQPEELLPGDADHIRRTHCDLHSLLRYIWSDDRNIGDILLLKSVKWKRICFQQILFLVRPSDHCFF